MPTPGGHDSTGYSTHADTGQGYGWRGAGGVTIIRTKPSYEVCRYCIRTPTASGPARISAVMRILVHDFGGYAFPLQLSRSLERRGHTVCHAYCASLHTTPPGVAANENSGPLVRGLGLGRPLNKYALARRWLDESRYGRLISDECAAFRPDIVLSGNAPLGAQKRLASTCRRYRIPFVFWVQDFLGIAAHRILRKKLPLVGEAVGYYFQGLERRLVQRSQAVVAISDDFAQILRDWNVERGCLFVIENWASLEELPVRPRKNAWADRKGLATRTCFLYAGTLSMKHNPDLLLQLAIRLRNHPDATLVVISQGMGAEWLLRKKALHALENLLMLPYQPKSDLPDVYATSDVLVAILEDDAGGFSVPSKVLTYLCAERPLLLAVPADNLAARMVIDAGAGCVVAPNDMESFLQAAEVLLSNPHLRRQMGIAAREYAEQAFDIEQVTDRFLAVFQRATA